MSNPTTIEQVLTEMRLWKYRPYACLWQQKTSLVNSSGILGLNGIFNEKDQIYLCKVSKVILNGASCIITNKRKCILGVLDSKPLQST